MKIETITIQNFRGISSAELRLPEHGVLIGDNNTGKSTILEAIDLVLGPDRLRGQSVIDEHDFYQGKYLANLSVSTADAEEEGENIGLDEEPAQEAVAAVQVADLQVADGDDFQDGEDSVEIPEIYVEVIVSHLNDEQLAYFKNYVEFWNIEDSCLLAEGQLANVDNDKVVPAIRFSFSGRYNEEEDDFEVLTYYTKSKEEGEAVSFSRSAKQKCGFLYLRTLRTGSRALSLERGSLLDVILRIKELRPNIWENTLDALRDYVVAEDPELGISGVLASISKALQKYVPNEWGNDPQLRISNLTRDNLRRVITAFLVTGEDGHLAPFYRQGTGTINMLVLAMLSQIAEDKQNVVFAMEEPEIAVPPYAQKQIVAELRKLSTQSILTSHSPYVLEEFDLEQTMVLSRDSSGNLNQETVTLPKGLRPSRYRNDFRTRFCEGLLARRILIMEGATEASCIPVAARRLAELNPTEYSSIEAMGFCPLDATSETLIKRMAIMYGNLRKEVFACCDKQSPEAQKEIESVVTTLFMHEEKGIEDLVLSQTTEAALLRHVENVDWPQKITDETDPNKEPFKAFRDYFIDQKPWAISDFIAQCNEDEIPQWFKDIVIELRQHTSVTKGEALEAFEATAAGNSD